MREPELLFWNRDLSRGSELGVPHQLRINSGFRGVQTPPKIQTKWYVQRNYFRSI